MKTACQGKNGTGGGAPDTRQCLHGIHIKRKAAMIFFTDNLRGFMQIAGAGVITEAGPEVQNPVERRLGKGLYIGKGGHKALVVRDHRADLGLL